MTAPVLLNASVETVDIVYLPMVNNKAFTLIELLIGAFLVALFFGITLVSMRGFGQKKALEVQKDRLVGALELAKKKARVGDSGGCTKLNYYQLSILSDVSYRLMPVCLTGSGDNETFTIPASSTVRIAEYTNQNTLFQSVTSQVTSNCIIVNDTAQNSCYKLTIIESGIINEENKAGVQCSCD